MATKKAKRTKQSRPASLPPSLLIQWRSLLAVVGVALLAIAAAKWDAAAPYIWKLTTLLAPEGPSTRAAGYFPEGCRWRDAAGAVQPGFWDVRGYEYWNETAGKWRREEQPAACRLDLPPLPADWPGSGDSAATSMRCTARHCVFRNLWMSQGKFFVLSDNETFNEPVTITRDIVLRPLMVRSAAAFSAQVDAQVASGGTVLIDFLYFIHPTAIGHWLEHLMPLVSALREEKGNFPAETARVLLLHLKRTHIMEWVRAALGAALGIAADRALPLIIFQKEQPSVWNQIGHQLEGVPDSEWVCFEHVLVVKDTFTDGDRVAATQEDAATFRSRAFRMHHMQPPPPSSTPPHTITLFRKSSNRRILNEGAVVKVLQEFGPVKVTELTNETPFAEQLALMAGTGLLVSVHTSALANAVFLPPGAAVVELIHRNWVWSNLDQSFKAQSDAMGDIHHYAWRAVRPEHCSYINPRDEQRFGGEEWAGEKCDTEECTEAHTHVDVVVDIIALRALLKDRMPLVWGGVPVKDAALPWPSP